MRFKGLFKFLDSFSGQLLTLIIVGWGAKFGPEGSSIIGSPSGNPE